MRVNSGWSAGSEALQRNPPVFLRAFRCDVQVPLLRSLLCAALCPAPVVVGTVENAEPFLASNYPTVD
jgi:hypothetical protein